MKIFDEIYWEKTTVIFFGIATLQSYTPSQTNVDFTVNKTDDDDENSWIIQKICWTLIIK